MDEPKQSREELAEEFRNLGRNLVDTLRGVWESPERQRLQKDLEAGLAEFSATLKEEADKFSQSPTGQQVKSEWEDLKGRVDSGEAEAYARQEILSVLRRVNSELEKASQRWQTHETSSGDDASPDPT
jgi:predicted component of type VI protein secretion system